MRSSASVVPITVLFASALASCVGLSKGYPQRRFHDVETERSGAVRLATPATVLEVPRFEISQRFEGGEIVRRTGDLTWEPDYYDVFFVPPDAMMTEETRKWLARSGLFAYVVDTSSLAEATHVLEGNVTSLYGDLRDEPRAIVEAQFVLLDQRVDPPAIVHAATYSEAAPLRDDSSEEVVLGFRVAIERILARLEDDLARSALSGSE